MTKKIFFVVVKTHYEEKRRWLRNGEEDESCTNRARDKAESMDKSGEGGSHLCSACSFWAGDSLRGERSAGPYRGQVDRQKGRSYLILWFRFSWNQVWPGRNVGSVGETMEIMTSRVRREVRQDSGMPYRFVNNIWDKKCPMVQMAVLDLKGD